MGFCLNLVRPQPSMQVGLFPPLLTSFIFVWIFLELHYQQALVDLLSLHDNIPGFFQSDFWTGLHLPSWRPGLRSCFLLCSTLSCFWSSLYHGHPNIPSQSSLAVSRRSNIVLPHISSTGSHQQRPTETCWIVHALLCCPSCRYWGSHISMRILAYNHRSSHCLTTFSTSYCWSRGLQHISSTMLPILLCPLILTFIYVGGWIPNLWKIYVFWVGKHYKLCCKSVHRFSVSVTLVWLPGFVISVSKIGLGRREMADVSFLLNWRRNLSKEMPMNPDICSNRKWVVSLLQKFS